MNAIHEIAAFSLISHQVPGPFQNLRHVSFVYPHNHLDGIPDDSTAKVWKRYHNYTSFKGSLSTPSLRLLRVSQIRKGSKKPSDARLAHVKFATQQ